MAEHSCRTRHLNSERLRKAIGRFRRPTRAAVDLSPGSPFEALLDARLKALEQQLEEVKGRVHGLMFLLAGAVIVQVVMGLVIG